MTFSDKKVAQFVREHFVAAWVNRAPVFHNEDYSTERWIFETSMEAYPTKNICTFFLTPDLKTFGYVAGYYCPEMFLECMQAALDARTDGRPSYRASSERFKRKMSGPFECKTRAYRQFEHAHSPACGNAAREGWGYLSALFGRLSEMTELPDWEQIRFDYLWGNSFSEETRRLGGSTIRGSCVKLQQ